MEDKEKKAGASPLNLKSGDSRTKKGSASLLARIPKMKSTPQMSMGFLGKFKSLAKMDMGMMASAGALVVSLPLAEHFMMKPTDQSLMKPGFSTRESGGVELFEPGTGGYAPGAPGMEEVAPLSARDPASLIDNGEMPSKSPVSAVSSVSNKVADTFRESVRAPIKRAAEKARAAMPVTVPPKVQFAMKGFDSGGGGSKAGAGKTGNEIADAAASASRGGASSSMGGAYASRDMRGYGGGGRGIGHGGIDRIRAAGDSLASKMNAASATQSLMQSGLGLLRVKNALNAGGGGMGYYQEAKQFPQSNAKKTYELEAPEPKEPAKPGGGGGLEPWWKKAKEIELQGEIDRQLAEEANARDEAQANKDFLRTAGTELAQGLVFAPLGQIVSAKLMNSLNNKNGAGTGAGTGTGTGAGTGTGTGGSTETGTGGSTETGTGGSTETGTGGSTETGTGGDAETGTGGDTATGTGGETATSTGGDTATATNTNASTDTGSSDLDLNASRTNGKVEELDGIEVKTRSSDSEAMYFYKGEMDNVEMKMESYEKKATQLEEQITACRTELEALRAKYDACMANPETAPTCTSMLVPPAPCEQASSLVKVQKDLLMEIRDLEVRVNDGAEGARGGLSIEATKLKTKLEELNTKVEANNTEWTTKVDGAKALIESLRADFLQADGNCAASSEGDCAAYQLVMKKLPSPQEQLDNIDQLKDRIQRLLGAMKRSPRPVEQLQSGVGKLTNLLQSNLQKKEQEITQKLALLERLQPMTLSIFDYPQRLQDVQDLQGAPKDIKYTDASATEVYTRHALGILRKGAGCRGVGSCDRSHLQEENDYWEARHHPTAELKQKGQALVYNRETPWSLYRLMTLRANIKNQPEPLDKYRVKLGKLVSEMKQNADALKKAHTGLSKGSVVFENWASRKGK